MPWLVGTIHPEEKHPISRRLIRFYEPLVTWSPAPEMVGDRRGPGPGARYASRSILHLGSEFMPPLEEGSILYMPSTMPGISIGEAQKLLQVTDRIIKQFPRGGPGPGQGGPGRDLHRPGPGVHAGNGDHPEAQIAVAPAYDPGKAHQRDERGPETARAWPTPGPCPSRAASRC